MSTTEVERRSVSRDSRNSYRERFSQEFFLFGKYTKIIFLLNFFIRTRDNDDFLLNFSLEKGTRMKWNLHPLLNSPFLHFNLNFNF